MKELQKTLLMITGFVLGYGLGDVLKGHEFNQIALTISLFLILINLTITIAQNKPN